MKHFEMNERLIQKRIMSWAYQGSSFVCNNYTPKGWFECDVFEITKSGYGIEYEIKLTRGDFRADRFKEQRRHDWELNKTTVLNKHTALRERSEVTPNRFYYAVPKGLISPEELPDWAGLLYIRETHIERVKPARMLHKIKVADKVRAHLLRSFYHRYQWWFLRRGPESVPL